MSIHGFISGRNRRIRTSAVIAFVTGLFLCPFDVGAQTSGGGSIRGHVADASGAAVPDAAISAGSPNVAGVFHTVSDAEGNYLVIDLPPANDYTITVERTGFDKFERKEIVVRAGLNISVDIPLRIGNVTETVEVKEESPLIDTSSSTQAVDLSGELIRSIPLTGRREWSDTLQLVPGILSASTDIYGGQVYFVRGSENENHATLLDGADIGSFKQNWPSNFIAMSTESLGDIQVKTGASDASAPSAMGMVINMASPTGGNQFHGALSTLIAPRSLNGENSPGGVSAVQQSYQPDFSFSGPIKRDKAWFFGSGRYIHRNDGISRTSVQIADLAEADPAFRPFDNQARGFIYTANTTVQLSNRHKLYGLIQYDHRTQGANDYTNTTNFGKDDYGGYAVAARLSSTWSPRLTSRFMVAYNDKSQDLSLAAIGGVGKLPEIDVYQKLNPVSGGKLTGNTLLGVLNNQQSRSLTPAHKGTISLDINYYVSNFLGGHELQTGIYFQPHAATKSTTYYANLGSYNEEDEVLANPNNPAAGYIPFHRQYVDNVTSSGLVTSYIGANDYAYYLQDRWRPTRRLTISPGLRADWVSAQDWMFHVTTQHTWNYAPRLGVTYVLTSDLKNVIRGSWGKIDDIPNAGYFPTVGSNTAQTRDVYDLDFSGNFATTITTPANNAISATKSIDRKRHQGYVEEWIGGYQRQLPHQTTIDASYVVRDYRDRPAALETNYIYNQGVWAGLNDPTQNSIALQTNNKWNWFVYEGLEFTLTHQTSRYQLISTYTRAWDHLDGTWQPNDPASIIQPLAFPNRDGIGTVRGNNGGAANSLGGDTRNRSWQHHQWRSGLSWNAPWNLHTSTSFSVQSGIPSGPIVTTIAAADPAFGPATLTINGRTVSNPLATTTRFAYATRGAGQLFTPWLTTWNARAGRVFPLNEHSSLELDLDIYNIPNAGAGQLFLGSNNNTSSTFGLFQDIQVPRSAQFSARYKF